MYVDLLRFSFIGMLKTSSYVLSVSLYSPFESHTHGLASILDDGYVNLESDTNRPETLSKPIPGKSSDGLKVSQSPEVVRYA